MTDQPKPEPLAAKELKEIEVELRRVLQAKETVQVAYLWRTKPRMHGLYPATAWAEASARLRPEDQEDGSAEILLTLPSEPGYQLIVPFPQDWLRRPGQRRCF